MVAPNKKEASEDVLCGLTAGASTDLEVQQFVCAAPRTVAREHFLCDLRRGVSGS